MSKQAQLLLQNSLSSLKVEGRGGKGMAVKHQKQLNIFLDKVMKLEEKEAEEYLIADIICEASDALSKLVIQDLTSLKLYITELRLQQEDNLDENTIKRFTYGKQVIEEALDKRKKKQQRPQDPINKNFLDHTPFWVGKKQLNKKNPEQLPPEARVITIQKNGIKQLTYQNDRGQLLSVFDTKVFIGLHKIWDRKGRNIEFEFSYWELLNCINLDGTGGYYPLLEESLETLYATSVVLHEYEFFENGKKKRQVTEKFHIMESTTDEKKFRDDGNLRSVTYRVRFSRYLQDTLLAGFVSYISLAMLEDLQTEAAKGLYLLLHSMDLQKDEYYEYPVETIINSIGVDPNRPAKEKTLLTKACEQLKNAGIIVEKEFFKNHDNKLMLRLYPAEWFKNSHTTPSIDLLPIPMQMELQI